MNNRRRRGGLRVFLPNVEPNRRMYNKARLQGDVLLAIASTGVIAHFMHHFCASSHPDFTTNGTWWNSSMCPPWGVCLKFLVINELGGAYGEVESTEQANGILSSPFFSDLPRFIAAAALSLLSSNPLRKTASTRQRQQTRGSVFSSKLMKCSPAFFFFFF